MTITITQQDVQARLRRDLDDTETTYFAGIAQEASDEVEGYLGFSYAAEDSIPTAVITVTSRVAARMYSRSASAQEGVDSRSAGMGQLSFTTHYIADSTTSGAWLARSEKVMIGRFRRSVNDVSLSRE